MEKHLNTTSFPKLIAATKRSCHPDMKLEELLKQNGFALVAGVDEAGRGPLAGPVVAAAVILDPHNIPVGLNDSKKLNAQRRAELYDEILKTSCVSIGSASAPTIDNINIRQATLSCMARAQAALAIKPDWTLVDGRDLPEEMVECGTAVIKGDGRSCSIAAASIIAKVTRDQMMIEAATNFPGYGFENHKGYGTKSHIAAIKNIGPCLLHRKSFAPMKHYEGD